MQDCIFCKIARGDIPADTVYEDDHVVAFRDLNPQAPTHILVIPRKHIATLNDLEADDEVVMGRIYGAARDIAAQQGLADGASEQQLADGGVGHGEADGRHRRGGVERVGRPYRQSGERGGLDVEDRDDGEARDREVDRQRRDPGHRRQQLQCRVEWSLASHRSADQEQHGHRRDRGGGHQHQVDQRPRGQPPQVPFEVSRA